MSMPPIQKKLIEQVLSQYCENKIPIEARQQVELAFTFRGDTVTLKEHRLFWNDSSKWTEMTIAQVRYERTTGNYLLYFADRNDKWKLYDILKPTKDFMEVLKEIDEDPTSVFWG